MRRAVGYVGIIGFVVCGSAVDSDGAAGMVMLALTLVFVLMFVYGVDSL